MTATRWSLTGRWSLAIPTAFLAAIIAACAGAPAASPSPSLTAEAPAGPPQVVIESPPGNAQVVAGTALDIVTTAVDAIGVGRIDLQVNGSTISSAEAPPGGLTSLSAVHLWVPETPGPASLSAVAYRTDGVAGAPFTISVLVLPAGASAAPYATYGQPLPTNRASDVPTDYVAPTYVPTRPPATQVGAAPTPTYHAMPTDYVAPTGAPPTTQATPTAHPTPTIQPTPTTAVAPTAPPDTTFAWRIAYNASNELRDEVSYPYGDTEDRINLEVTGLTNFPPGDHGTLNVFATCDGTGVQNVQIFVDNGAFPYACGQQIVNRIVTSESNRVTIVIKLKGPAYVHWTLNGNVAP